MKFLSKSLEIRRVLDFFPEDIASTLSSIGQVHLFSGKYQESLGYYEEALGIYKNLDDDFAYQITLTLAIIDKIDKIFKEYIESIEHLEKALLYTKKNDSPADTIRVATSMDEEHKDNKKDSNKQPST